jgi:superfamily II DNA or RNA helicase
LIGEGFDKPILDTLFLALPISWKGTLAQYAGRLNRNYPGKTEVRIYDYIDDENRQLQSMFKKRQAGYKALGYSLVSQDKLTLFDDKE